MKVSSNFHLEEFIPKEVYDQYGPSSIWFIDPVLIDLMQKLREDLGRSITINNWKWGGPRNYSGFRPMSYEKGGKLSQHRFGRACDFLVKDIAPIEVYEFIMEREQDYLPLGLTTIEDVRFTPTWNHIDIRWTKENKIKKVKP